MKIHVILACHNRRDVTVRCLERLMKTAAQCAYPVDVTVFDDGSTDGTGAAIRDRWPTFQVLPGDGSAFWAAGMAAAEHHVLGRDDVAASDCLLWLNDDVLLDIDALSRLTSWFESQLGSILVGAVRDPGSGVMTYSGLNRSGRHPLKFAPVEPLVDRVRSVQTFNGNFVAVPVAVARELDGIDGGFTHAFADIDYGLRAQRRGVDVWLAPSTFGVCSRNAVPPVGPLLEDWRRFVGIKGGGNFASLTRILKRLAPRTWPVFILLTYGLWWTRQLGSKVKIQALGLRKPSRSSR